MVSNSSIKQSKKIKDFAGTSSVVKDTGKEGVKDGAKLKDSKLGKESVKFTEPAVS